MVVSGGGDAIVHAWLLAEVLDIEAPPTVGCPAPPLPPPPPPPPPSSPFHVTLNAILWSLCGRGCPRQKERRPEGGQMQGGMVNWMLCLPSAAQQLARVGLYAQTRSVPTGARWLGRRTAASFHSWSGHSQAVTGLWAGVGATGGGYAASCSLDQTVRVYHCGTGAHLPPPLCH